MSALPAPRPPAVQRLALRGVQVAALATLIALALTVIGHQPLGGSLVYSLAIAFASWLCIDGGRALAVRWLQRGRPAARSAWPGWPAMAVCVAIGAPAGYLLGSALGDRVTGAHTPLALGEPRTLAALLLLSIVPSLIITSYFHLSGRVAAERARAEAAARAAAEHQLMLLQSQLEPHMLFNTLANLRVLIGVDAARAQAMLDRLIAFLRATLEASRAGSHPLAAEFARLADYLALMQVRMGARLATRFTLPDPLAARPVPPLLLQPLVENAIRHGLEPKVEGGTIEVGARREGERLVLWVHDDGVGLGAAPPSDGTRFGLAQVRERLAALYGERVRLTVGPDPRGGTLATLELPMDR